MTYYVEGGSETKSPVHWPYAVQKYSIYGCDVLLLTEKRNRCRNSDVHLVTVL